MPSPNERAKADSDVMHYIYSAIASDHRNGANGVRELARRWYEVRDDAGSGESDAVCPSG